MMHSNDNRRMRIEIDQWDDRGDLYGLHLVTLMGSDSNEPLDGKICATFEDALTIAGEMRAVFPSAIIDDQTGGTA